MPVYQQRGQIPRKRHTTFYKPDGSLYQEELIGTEGFSGLSTLAYHQHPPTRIMQMGEPYSVAPQIAISKNLQPLSFKGFNIPQEEDYIESRKTFFINNDLSIGVAAPSASPKYFYKNADADEMIFIHHGSGELKTMFGTLEFSPGDYLIVPRGTVYQFQFETPQNRFLIVESHSPIYTPNRYRNNFGQLGEHSPFCERDFRAPQDLETHDQTGEFPIYIKKQGNIYPFLYAHHPFDLVGWDGYSYPYAFSIHDFEPITGRIHLPPPIHQTFEGNNFVICSFVPRLYDYHPQAIPAPYHHSNIDSDEILYYVDGDFMSRNDIEKGQFTLHPGGLPHGPHPGAIERSIGKKYTEEMAVMIDPFRPVMITEDAMKYQVKDYYKSWLPKAAGEVVI